MLRFKNGEEEIPLRIEFECINLEWNRFAEMLSQGAVSYLELLRYSWFSERMIKGIALPRDDGRREEMSVTLLLGLIAIMASDFNVTPSDILKRVKLKLDAQMRAGETINFRSYD